MAIYLADRRILIPAMLATVMASWTAVPFLETVVGWNCGIDATWISLTTASLLLLAGSRFTDTNWLPLPDHHSAAKNFQIRPLTIELLQSHDGNPRPLGRNLSAVVSVAAGVAWISQNFAQNNASVTGWLLLTTTLVIQTLVGRARPLAGFSIAFGLVAGVLYAIENAYSVVHIATGLNLAAFGLWTAGCLLNRYRNRVADCYARPLQRVSTLMLLAFLFLWHGPKLIHGSTSPGEITLFEVLLAAATIVWSFQSARRMKIPGLAVFGTIVAMPLVSASVLSFANDTAAIAWYPLCWALALVSSLPLFAVVDRLTKTQPQRHNTFREYVTQPAQNMAHALLTVVVLLSVPTLSGKILAGAVAVFGIALLEGKRSRLTLIPSALLANWYVLAIVMDVCLTISWAGGSLFDRIAGTGFALAAAASLSALLFRIPATNKFYGVKEHGTLHRALLHAATFFAMTLTTTMWGHTLSPALVGFVLIVSVIVITDLMLSAIAIQSEPLVWASLLTAFASIGYLALFGVIPVHFGILSYGLLGVATLLYLSARAARDSHRWTIVCRPLQQVAWVLPAITLPIAIGSVFVGKTATWLGGDSQALLFAGAFYFWTGLQTKQRTLLILATTFVNVALMLLWVDLQWSDPQLFMIPIGVSVIGLVQLLRREIPQSMLNPLRYAGALMILVSPTFHIIGGSWWHLFSLMFVSVLIILAAIGLRLRALVYTGTGFLAADLIAMVCRGSFDNPNLLWLAGLCLGACVIGMAAVFEGQREKILGRIRVLASTLETWE